MRTDDVSASKCFLDRDLAQGDLYQVIQWNPDRKVSVMDTEDRDEALGEANRTLEGVLSRELAGLMVSIRVWAEDDRGALEPVAEAVFMPEIPWNRLKPNRIAH